MTCTFEREVLKLLFFRSLQLCDGPFDDNFCLFQPPLVCQATHLQVMRVADTSTLHLSLVALFFVLDLGSSLSLVLSTTVHVLSRITALFKHYSNAGQITCSSLLHSVVFFLMGFRILVKVKRINFLV